MSSSPKPALDVRSGSRSAGATSDSPIASAASTTAVPSGTASQRAAISRPSGSETTAVRHSPPRAACSASAVPLPPSATGSSTASTPSTRRNPAARCAAASTGVRTPLRLAGHASARAFGLRLTRLLGELFLLLLVHLLEHGVRDALAREEDRADADPDRRLDRLQTDPERD